MDKILYWLIGTLLIRRSFRDIQKLSSSSTTEKVDTETKELIKRGIKIILKKHSERIT